MDQQIKLLYVEDDMTLSYVTGDNLQLHGYSVDFAVDGLEGWNLFRENKYDLCIFDVMLPRMDGYELAMKVRHQNRDIPIIFLTARSTREDKIHGLRIGADDYITKPFSIEELVLKIEVFLRRTGLRKETQELAGTCAIGSFTFDMSNHTLIRDGVKKQLTHREAQLLAAFCRYPDTLIKRNEILMKIWGDDHYFASRSLDVFISRLRKYLKDDPALKIENIHNVGYRLVTNQSHS
jgi:DNA-binding response OmpR family regulator